MDMNKVYRAISFFFIGMTLIGIATAVVVNIDGSNLTPLTWFNSNKTVWDAKGNASYPVNVSNATGTLPKVVMPANVSYNDSVVGLASAKPSAVQYNIASVTWILVLWGTEIYDSNNEFANNNYTAPVTGTYHIDVSNYITDMGAGTYQQKLYINGAPTIYSSYAYSPIATDMIIGFSADVRLNAGDVVSVFFWTDLAAGTTDIYNVEGSWVSFELKRRG